MENNGHSAKVKLWLGHITWLQINAKCGEGFATYISSYKQKSFEQISRLSTVWAKQKQKKIVKILRLLVHSILKDTMFSLVTPKDMVHLTMMNVH